MSTFGKALGELIRSKREGTFTQLELAIEAYDDETKIRRIVELETGKIARPQQKTIQPIIDTLNITRAELESCQQQPTIRPETADAIGLSRALLENLARRFEHSSPDAPLTELENFLNQKAAEWADFRVRINELKNAESALSNQLGEIEFLINQGEFDSADKTLSGAEEIQDERILEELRKKSRLRRMRGEAALMAGDLNRAIDHFEKSAELFSMFDKQKEADCRLEYATELRYFAYRYRDMSALRAAGIALIRNLKINRALKNDVAWCRCALALGGVRLRLFHFDESVNRVKHTKRAKVYYDKVLGLCSEKKHPEIFATALGDSANWLGHKLANQSSKERQLELMESIRRYNLALDITPKESNSQFWGILMHNVGCSYISLAELRLDDSAKSIDLINAIGVLEKSFEVRDLDESFQYWLASSRTLSEALISLAEISSPGNQIDLLARATSVLSEANLRTNQSEHPHQWAEIQHQLQRLSG